MTSTSREAFYVETNLPTNTMLVPYMLNKVRAWEVFLDHAGNSLKFTQCDWTDMAREQDANKHNIGLKA